MKPKNEKQAKRFIEKVNSQIGKHIYDHNLIEEGDHILLGLSGGKDSLILLETLAMRKNYMPIKFEMTAVYVQLTNIPYQSDTDYLRKICETNKVPFFVEECTPPIEDRDKPLCFICSWNRRKQLFALAEKYKCNKLALGHHRDDAIETLLMNMIYHGSISSLPSKLSMFNGDLKLIRPLLFSKEEDLIQYAEIKQFELQKKVCPHGENAKRAKLKELVKLLDEWYPGAKTNLFNSMNKIFTEYLPTSNELKDTTKDNLC